MLRSEMRILTYENSYPEAWFFLSVYVDTNKNFDSKQTISDKPPTLETDLKIKNVYYASKEDADH